jgi:hypothetical protein
MSLKSAENVPSLSEKGQIKSSISNEELYQGRASSTVDSEDNVATLENNSSSRNEESTTNFKTKGEKLRFTILVIGIVLSMFMMSLNSTVIAPALSIIATELNALQNQTWIATAYLVALNAFQPLSGRVSRAMKKY